MRHRLVAALTFVCLLAATAHASPACAVAEAKLLGSWTGADDRGEFEQFELARDDGARIFRSWLHERPEVAGAPWRYDAATCRLHIGDGGGTSWDYHVALDRRGALLLRDTDGDAPAARYRRLPD